MSYLAITKNHQFENVNGHEKIIVNFSESKEKMTLRKAFENCDNSNFTKLAKIFLSEFVKTEIWFPPMYNDENILLQILHESKRQNIQKHNNAIAIAMIAIKKEYNKCIDFLKKNNFKFNNKLLITLIDHIFNLFLCSAFVPEFDEIVQTILQNNSIPFYCFSTDKLNLLKKKHNCTNIYIVDNFHNKTQKEQLDFFLETHAINENVYRSIDFFI